MGCWCDTKVCVSDRCVKLPRPLSCLSTEPITTYRKAHPMAKAPALLPGYQYRILPNGGDLAGEVVTILDNISFPDSDPRRRKVTVEHDGNTIYILPRMLEDLPIIAKAPVAPVVPATPVQTAVEQALAPQV